MVSLSEKQGQAHQRGLGFKQSKVYPRFCVEIQSTQIGQALQKGQVLYTGRVQLIRVDLSCLDGLPAPAESPAGTPVLSLGSQSGLVQREG